MDIRIKREAAHDRIYDDFNPFFDWTAEERNVTLMVMLTGYRKHQLKIQLTSIPSLRISGERQVTESRWLRFNKEFQIDPDLDTENVSAKFDDGLLYVKFPRLTSPVKDRETESPPEEASGPPQNVDQQEGSQEGTPREKEDKAETRTDEVSEQTPQKEKKPSHEEEKIKTETAASREEVPQKVRFNGLTDDTPEAATSRVKVPEMIKGAKTAKRLKTRILDFTTPSLGPSNREYSEAAGDLDKGINNGKTLMNLVVVVILLVGVLWVYVRNAFRSSSLGGTKIQEL